MERGQYPRDYENKSKIQNILGTGQMALVSTDLDSNLSRAVA